VRVFTPANRVTRKTPSQYRRRHKVHAKERLAAGESVRPAPGTAEPYRILIEQIPAITYISDCGPDGHWNYVSPQIEALLGYTPQEWIADNDLWVKTLHVDDREAALAEERRIERHPGPYRFEYRLVARHGREVWLRDEGVVLSGAGGSKPLQHGILTDITEVKEAELAHRASEERVRLALEGLGMGCWELDAHTGLITWDENLYTTLKVNSATFSRKFSDFLTMVHPEDQPRMQEELRRSAAERRPYSMEYRVIFPDGKVQWRASFARPLFDPQGKLLRYAGVNQIITERKLAEEALRQSETRYRSVFENNIAGLTIATEDGQILECNEKLLDIFGCKSKAEIQAINIAELYADPADRQRLIRQLRDKNVAQNIELRHKRKDGSFIWCAHNVRRVENTANGQITLHSTIVDISERKQAETSLRESEERLRTAMNAASMGAWEWEAATNCTTWDDNFQNLLGTSPAKSASSPEGVLHYIIPEDRPRFLEAVKRCSATGERYALEFRICRPDGEIRWISDQGRPTLDDSGKVVRFQGVAQDVTERRQAERSLRESQERLNLALETAELGMWEWHPDSDSFYFDERECRLLGMTPDTAPKTSREFIQYVHPEDREIVVQAVKRALRTGESSGGEVRVRLPDGSYRWLSSTGRIVREASGKIEIVRGITLDITERRKLEEQLRLAQKWKPSDSLREELRTISIIC